MKPYVQTLIRPEAEQIYEKAVKMVVGFMEGLPEGDLYKGKPVRCHEVARAAGRVLGLKVVDGICGRVQHSWLVLPAHQDPTEREFILDVYTVGRLPPVQLVDTFYGILAIAQKPLRKNGTERAGLYLPQSLRVMRVHPDWNLVRIFERQMRKVLA